MSRKNAPPSSARDDDVTGSRPAGDAVTPDREAERRSGRNDGTTPGEPYGSDAAPHVQRAQHVSATDGTETCNPFRVADDKPRAILADREGSDRRLRRNRSQLGLRS